MMNDERTIKPIGHIRTDFSEKFGIPRQPMLVPGLKGTVVFEGRYSDPAAFTGLEEYSHIWILWGFSKSERDDDTAPLTVCPPRLGGKIKKGVFAARSPYRPNGIGISCVKLEKIINGGGKISLEVSGIDMLDGTPVYDIKPYIPYSDCAPDAKGSFGQSLRGCTIEVDFPNELLQKLPEDKRKTAFGILEQDPRAAYNKEPGYVFGLSYAGFDIRFTADNEKITVRDVVKKDGPDFEKIK